MQAFYVVTLSVDKIIQAGLILRRHTSWKTSHKLTSCKSNSIFPL